VGCSHHSTGKISRCCAAFGMFASKSNLALLSVPLIAGFDFIEYGLATAS
jgi:hypothetical protein